MKRKLLAYCIALSVAMLFFGCSSGGNNEPKRVDNSNAPTETQSPQSTADEPTKFGVGESADLNNVVATLVNVSENSGGDFNRPSEGNVFVVCEFEIENNSDKELAISSMMCFSSYVDDYFTSMSLSAMMSSDKRQLDGKVSPGKKMNGIIGYEVPSDWSELEIQFTPDFWTGKDIVFTYTK